jgi:uncharacterized membrane protein
LASSEGNAHGAFIALVHEEGAMQDLIAVRFQGIHRAAEVLRQLQSLDARGTIDLADAVAVHRTEDGRLHVDRSIETTGRQGAALGGLVGAILGGALAAPLTGGASVAAAATAVGAGMLGMGSVGSAVGATEAADWKARYGVPEEFVQQVGGMVQPGASAVFAMVRSDENPVAIARHFKGYGGTVLRTTLVSAKAARVQKTIGTRTGETP